ncbi:MAG: biotin--[Clostridia bacterium]|nr:biotin--[acetyl-CoA-carboxylase] ligase [Clostridia bacterium]
MEIQYFDHLNSTNETAKAAAMVGAAPFYTVVAKHQSAGVGRMGRSFASPEGGTYFSTVLRPKLARQKFGAITPFCAVAVHRAITELTGVSLDIKWINDLLLNGKKVCGILAVAGEDQKGEPFVVLGIGINTGRGNLPPELADIATCLPYDDIEGLIGRILFWLQNFESEIMAGSWVEYYRAHASCLGSAVTVIKNESSACATALDIDAEGGLLVLYENGTREFLRGGEISLRFR